MPDSPPDIRNAARALVVRDGGVLLLRKEYEDGAIRYALPGGAQEEGETLEQTLQRECVEEIGVEVRITGRLYVAEYFRRRSSQPEVIRHLLECLFHCEVSADYQPHNGHRPDKHQVGVEWVPTVRLATASLSHPFLTQEVAEERVANPYLGVFRDDDVPAQGGL